MDQDTPTPSQSQTAELLEDIQFINQQNQQEIQHFNDYFKQCIETVPVPTSDVGSLVDKLSTYLGQLSVKVKLVEKAIRSLQSIYKSEVITWTANEESTANLQTTIADSLLAPEDSADGTRFCWSGSDPEIQFSFTLNRRVDLEMKIRMFALIKLKYLKQLKILVDGKHLKHSFGLEGSLFVVSCVVPASHAAARIHLKIVLPDTHSLAELARSHDNRKLGLAFTGISFSIPESGFFHSIRYSNSLGLLYLHRLLGAKK